MKNSLLISDLHLTSAPRDEYRFAVFDRVAKEKVKTVWILGDLTDSCDNHSAQLVNRICDHIAALAKRAEVRIVRGNHDGINPEWPFFRFLRMMPHVHFYTEPEAVAGDDGVLVLPHSRNPDKDWADVGLDGYKWVAMHATFKGSISESGVEIGDLDIPNQLRRKNLRIYSGDVHVPQKLGNVTYVGSPHHVHYGDNFSPRMIQINADGIEKSIPLPGIRRLMIDVSNVRELRKVECSKGDQAKVRLHLAEADLGKWQELRKAVVKECRDMGLDLAAVELVREQSDRPLLRTRATTRSAEDVLEDFLHRTPFAADTGRELLRHAQENK